MSNFKEDLVILLKAKTKCIWIKSYEELYIMNEIKSIILTDFLGMKLVSWSYFTGYQKEQLTNKETKEESMQMTPDVLLEEIATRQLEGKLFVNNSNQKEIINKNENIYVIKDFHLLNSEKLLIRGIRDIKERESKEMLSYNPIIVISPIVDIPMEHEKLFTVLEYETPDTITITNIINNFVKGANASDKYTNVSEETKLACVSLAKGLTADEIKSYCARSLVKHNTLSTDMFFEARLDLIKKTGILEYIKPSISMQDMGGNHSFKDWVTDVKETFTPEAIEFGVEKSKGFLGLGIPGTAKSLSAEMIAQELKLPLLKFQMSKIMNSHVGKSEQNMANAINIIKSCSPCVLFIDEVEKTLSGTGSSDSSDGGTLMRVVGMLLELMASKDSNDIFTVMTSNDVSKLPPELTRSGRLDTMWYFGLPLVEERLEIFKIHFGKTKAKIDNNVMEYAATMSENFTGAEIKECVKVSMRKAFRRYKQDKNPNIIQEDIDLAISEIIPIYESSKEKIMSLEIYAKNRARMANEIADASNSNSSNENILDYTNIDLFR